jgi:apolipoprotein N-acyltransferase
MKREQKQIFALFLLSWVIVAFGQPAWSSILSACSSVFGYSLAFKALISIEKRKSRFKFAFLWYFSVQLIQLSWLPSHQYSYIYAVYLVLTFLLGLQFALWSLFLDEESMLRPVKLLALTGGWVLMEWTRLFFLSGYVFNPAGLALTAYLIPLQTAALWGVYGLSAWLILTNFAVLRASMIKSRQSQVLALTLAAFPYIFGLCHIAWHENQMTQDSSKLNVLTVDTFFPPEETQKCQTSEDFINCASKEWEIVIDAMRPSLNEKVDLIVFPEIFVPFGMEYLVYSHENVEKAFVKSWGAGQYMPPFKRHLAAKVGSEGKAKWMVNNSYWAQTIASRYQADLIIGLDYTERKRGSRKLSYNAAIHYRPELQAINTDKDVYTKRVLIPMGEYIPLSCLQSLVSRYGISDSFGMGKEAKVFSSSAAYGVSVCYEEMFSALMRECRLAGADMLINVTNDGWYPHSRLAKQHFDHARLRSVENGIPLVRSCNFGVSGAVDSLGRIVKIGKGDAVDWTAYAHVMSIPRYHYKTLYTYMGDFPILCMSGFFLLLGCVRRK